MFQKAEAELTNHHVSGLRLFLFYCVRSDRSVYQFEIIYKAIGYPYGLVWVLNQLEEDDGILQYVSKSNYINK